MVSAAQQGTDESSGAEATPASLATVPLGSLAPAYDVDQHGIYVRRLEEAVKDARNLNIALTGRYGAGKSSALDEFVHRHRRVTQRLAISTLAPGDEGATKTNRIQKEIVKQLLYGASRKVGKSSRFSRIAVLSKPKAFVQSLAMVGCLGMLLYLFGWLPPIKWTHDHEKWIRLAAWAGTAALATLMLTVARVVAHNRITISELSAMGASVSLSDKVPTYFDQYLDEIVHYFDSESKDVIIFEDVDRFEDPHIFEALRELNVLLNDTPKRRAKRRGNRAGRCLAWILGKLPWRLDDKLVDKLPWSWSARLLGRAVPLRFVYAVRDSVFEKIGTDLEAADGDAAVAATQRANRTKFFDLVIPVVPFISHRNARELLSSLLEKAAISGIDRHLVNVVAQHVTDMRLLRNICNEYLVFAERLLESDKVAPGLTPSNLFALVTYKNFHLEDFEEIARRNSDLDTLYDYRRDLVRDAVADLEARKRALWSGATRIRTREALAQELGERLRGAAEVAKSTMSFSNWPRINYRVGAEEFASAQIGTYKFWQALAEAGSVTLIANASDGPGGNPFATVATGQLARLAPEGMEAGRWADFDQYAAQARVAEIDRSMAFLRGADFADLAAKPEFKLAVEADDEPGDAEVPVECTFDELIDSTLKSDLARELVRSGYIDRNFALYAAVFYGTFTGVDVATFMVQNVEANTMEIDYQFSGPAAIANLLDEAGDDFTHTAAAYNIQVLDYLLGEEHPRSGDLVTRIVTTFDDDAQTFLTSYLTSGQHRKKLCASLAAQPWLQVFTYLVTNQDVPDDVRPVLVDSALVASDPSQPYDLGVDVTDFILKRYRDMPVFMRPHASSAQQTAVKMLDKADAVIPDLDGLEPTFRNELVAENLYSITADNLRTGLDITGAVPLDRVRNNETAYEYCLTFPADYLGAIAQDDDTPHAITSAETLTAVLTSVAGDAPALWAEAWDDVLISRLLRSASPASKLQQLTNVPKTTWTALAEARLFAATLNNFEEYRAAFGIDAHLAALLLAAGAIDTSPENNHDWEPDSDAKRSAAIELLNSTAIADAADRVRLVTTLDLDGFLDVDELRAEPSDLLAELLEHGLVADDATTFAHFQPAGWDAIGPAISVSTNISTFIRPDLVAGMVGDLFNDPDAPAKVGHQVVEALDEYVPTADKRALVAAGTYAANHGIRLAPPQVQRIADAGALPHTLALRLLQTASPAPDATQIIGVFMSLGSPYQQISITGSQFEVPYDETHRSLLQTLQEAHRCTFRKKLRKDRYTVEVP